MIYKCEYCESDYEGRNCPNCGAPRSTKPTNYKYTTNGYTINKTSINNTINVTTHNYKKDITEQPGFVICMLFLFFPVGLYYMWKNHVFNVLTRLIITSFFVFMIYAILKTGQIDTTNTVVSGDDNTAIVAVTTTPTPTPTPTAIPTPTPKPLTKKEKFIKKVTKVSGVNKKTAGNLYNLLRKEMGFGKVYIIQKSETGKANYDFYADKFTLTVAFNKNGVSTIKWGFYILYDGKEINIDKQGLLDRQLENEFKYYMFAMEIIWDNIKTPKTTEFPDRSTVNMQRKGDLVGVQGYFDSQNIYGALVRSKYTIEFSVIDLDNNKYKPVYINIDGEITGKWIELD